MTLGRETEQLCVWLCETCRAKPRSVKTKRGYDGMVVVQKWTGLKPLTSEEVVELAVNRERRRAAMQRETDERREGLARERFNRRANAD